jgi:TRAP-type mannitol/chloroaromatic compound transport system permease small subunit
MESLLKLADVFDRIARFMGKLAGFVVLPLIAIIMFDVITRKIDFLRIGMSQLSWYWLIEPIKLQDMQWHLHAVILLLSFGYAYLMNAHVRVDIFREGLSQRGQAWVEFWGLLIMAIPYLLLITYFAFVFVSISTSQGEGSESLTGIPMRYIIKSFTIVGFLLMLIAVLATFIRICAVLFGSPENREMALGQLNIFTDEVEALLEEGPPPGADELYIHTAKKD